MKKLLTTCLAALTLLLCTHQVDAQEYETAAGLRAAWGFAVTGKKFINDDGHAVEVIANYRSFSSAFYDYSWLSFTGLYEVHKPWETVLDGLYWYYGGGINFTTYSGDFDLVDDDIDAFFGIAGCLGLDYKFEEVPINISVDWIPVFGFGAYGFGGEGGGLAVRYTFN